MEQNIHSVVMLSSTHPKKSTVLSQHVAFATVLKHLFFGHGSYECYYTYRTSVFNDISEEYKKEKSYELNYYQERKVYMAKLVGAMLYALLISLSYKKDTKNDFYIGYMDN